LKRRAEAELRTHGSITHMKQTSGMYTEMEWIKSDSTPDQDKGGSASELGRQCAITLFAVAARLGSERQNL